MCSRLDNAFGILIGERPSSAAIAVFARWIVIEETRRGDQLRGSCEHEFGQKSDNLERAGGDVPGEVYKVFGFSHRVLRATIAARTANAAHERLRFKNMSKPRRTYRLA